MTDEYPAITLYGKLDYPEAAKWWYEQAMINAKETNVLKEELRNLRRYRIVRMLEKKNTIETIECYGCGAVTTIDKSPGWRRSDAWWCPKCQWLA